MCKILILKYDYVPKFLEGFPSSESVPRCGSIDLHRQHKRHCQMAARIGITMSKVNEIG
jgi:hypothetical protein